MYMYGGVWVCAGCVLVSGDAAALPYAVCIHMRVYIRVYAHDAPAQVAPLARVRRRRRLPSPPLLLLTARPRMPGSIHA